MYVFMNNAFLLCFILHRVLLTGQKKWPTCIVQQISAIGCSKTSQTCNMASFSFVSSATGLNSSEEKCHQGNLWMCHCVAEAAKNNVFQLSWTTPPFLRWLILNAYPHIKFNHSIDTHYLNCNDKEPASQVTKRKTLKKIFKTCLTCCFFPL